MNKTAVIVAGGSGSRMGGSIPKQFLELRQKPLFIRSMDAFLYAFPDIKIILVLPPDYLETGKTFVSNFFPNVEVHFVSGGITRFQSVKKGLALAEQPSVIFVHDAVRCLVSVDLIRSCYDHAMEHGSAIPAIGASDSVRILHNEHSEPIDRNLVRLIQTPQTFLSEILIPAFEQEESSLFTDESTVVESSGKTVHLIEGEPTNIKITIRRDLLVADSILSER